MFVSEEVGGRVRCFCVGIFEGSCIYPFWEVGGSRFFLQKVSKIPRLNPPPIKDVPSFSHAPSRTDGPDVTVIYNGQNLKSILFGLE